MKELNRKSKLFALLINIYNPKENFEIAKTIFKSENPSDLINFGNNSDCDILALKFNLSKKDEIPNAIDLLKNQLPNIQKPLMILGSGDDEIDIDLLPLLIKNLDRENCIIGNANEKTYKSIVPEIIKSNNYLILKSPIDINLAKELNILSIDMGLDKNKIIMDTDIGGLGYGYEYGFSILEKAIQEANKGDEYLTAPLFSNASTEALKTKEAKSSDYSSSYGELENRAKMIELSACAGILAAGANIITVNIPTNIPILKGLV